MHIPERWDKTSDSVSEQMSVRAEELKQVTEGKTQQSNNNAEDTEERG